MEAENEILFTISKEDIQEAAIHYLGREMNEDEYLLAKKLLQYGIGENLIFAYSGIFFEMMNKKNNV